MKIYLLLVLLVVSFKAVTSCEKICEFLYNNSDSQGHAIVNNTSFEVAVEQGSLTGIITASLDLCTPTEKTSYDFLKFYTHPSGQPLNIRIHRSGNLTWFRITGMDEKGNQTGYWDLGTLRGKYPLQIGQFLHYYKIHLGPRGKGMTMSLEYNYNKVEDWNKFQNNNMRLKDTVRIKNNGTCAVYKYISSCSDATPRLCDEQATVTEAVELGSSYNLSCTGSGAPFLEAEWTKDGQAATVVPSNTNMTSQPDHRIESKLLLANITTEHLGTWTCHIRNRNFGNSVTKTYWLCLDGMTSLPNAKSVEHCSVPLKGRL